MNIMPTDYTMFTPRDTAQLHRSAIFDVYLDHFLSTCPHLIVQETILQATIFHLHFTTTIPHFKQLFLWILQKKEIPQRIGISLHLLSIQLCLFSPLTQKSLQHLAGVTLQSSSQVQG